MSAAALAVRARRQRLILAAVLTRRQARARHLGLCGERFAHLGVCDEPAGHGPILWGAHAETVGGPLGDLLDELEHAEAGRVGAP